MRPHTLIATALVGVAAGSCFGWAADRGSQSASAATASASAAVKRSTAPRTAPKRRTPKRLPAFAQQGERAETNGAPASPSLPAEQSLSAALRRGVQRAQAATDS